MGKRRAWDNEEGDAVFVERPDGGRDIIREYGGETYVFSTKPPEGDNATKEQESQSDDQ